MIRNYLRASFRSLTRETSNTLINMAGLTLGITGSLILFLFIKDGSSYDTFHTKKERIYRVVSKSKGNSGDTFTQGVPAVLPEAFKNDFSEAEEVVFTSYHRENLITISEPSGELKKYEEPKGVVFTQASFFKIFDRPIVTGSVKTLDQPNQAVISKSWASKYFHKQDPIGKVVNYGNNEYKISAIVDDYPSNTDLPFDLMLSYITIKKSLDARGWHDIADTDNCYFLMREGEPISKIESRLPAFVKKYFGQNDSDTKKDALLMQPLQTLHSDMRFGNYNKKMPEEGKIAFAVVAVFLLVSCCINFINLTTAGALKRAKEVGIRKVLGSTRGQLVFKLMGEAILVTLLSVLISLALAEALLGFLNPFMDLSLTLKLGSDTRVWLFLAIVTIVVAVLSGLYPAIVVSAYKPALALKNQISQSSSGAITRKGLVVAQFFISQFFIIATIVIVLQHEFTQNHDIGFAQEAIVTLPIPVGESTSGLTHVNKMRSLKNELLRLAGVEKVSLSQAPPSHKSVLGTSYKVVGKSEELNTQVKQVDGDYLNLFKIKLIAGQPLTDGDTITGLWVNEKFAKVSGFATNEEIIGKEIELWDRHIPVKGVVKDFNTMSLSKPIEPVVLLNNLSGYQSLSIKLNTGNIPNTLKQVQTRWEAAYPEYIFKYSFMEEQVSNLYQGERKSFVLLSIFAGTAIFIGCLGLFGLVTFMANQKTKEIGVRKVLGASVESIVLLFSKEFVKLILIGFALSAPIAGYVMSKILERNAYRIEIGPMIFLIGMGVTFVIAILTVGFRSIKAALVNPVQSLRAE